MKEKQQTALQTLIAWGDEMMKEHPMKLLSFADAIDKAEELLEMEKEQIMDFAMKFMMQDRPIVSFYNEIYGEKLKGDNNE